MTQYALINTDDEFGVAPVRVFAGDSAIVCGEWVVTSGREICPTWNFYAPCQCTFLYALDMFLLVPNPQ